MLKTTKQLEPRHPRPLSSAEALILFVLSSNTPPIDDAVFDDAFEAITAESPEPIWFGSWKVLRVPATRFGPPVQQAGRLGLPKLVIDEVQSWHNAQPESSKLEILGPVELLEIPGYALVVVVEDLKPDSKPVSIQLGGREIHEGQTMSPKEAEDFLAALISANPGPVTIDTIDESTGSRISARVQDWNDFTGGPGNNAQALKHHISELRQKGYLAFRQVGVTKYEYETSYLALTAEYFVDFDAFVRFQDIPKSYLMPVSSSPTCFISHRWESLTHPDPRGVQFDIIRQFIREDGARSIWYDFSCVPQQPLTPAESALFKDSLRDLNSLVMTTEFLNLVTEDYIGRAWCYYEWVVSSLFPIGRRIEIRQSEVTADYYPLLADLVLDGRRPHLVVSNSSDMPFIDELVKAGVEMFKTLALSVTLTVLNRFGFNLGVGIAARFASQIEFNQLWMVWQVLAGSSSHSGIRLPDLLDADRLENILRERHERFGTHLRIYQELKTLLKIPLDLRIIEQHGQDKLLELVASAQRLGPVPAAFTTLALVKIIYSFAGSKPQPM